LSRQDLDAVYRRMTNLADTQKHIHDTDLHGIVADVCGAPRRAVTDLAAPEAGYGFGV
jgi:hypothetical protein